MPPLVPLLAPALTLPPIKTGPEVTVPEDIFMSSLMSAVPEVWLMTLAVYQ